MAWEPNFFWHETVGQLEARWVGRAPASAARGAGWRLLVCAGVLRAQPQLGFWASAFGRSVPDTRKSACVGLGRPSTARRGLQCERAGARHIWIGAQQKAAGGKVANKVRGGAGEARRAWGCAHAQATA